MSKKIFVFLSLLALFFTARVDAGPSQIKEKGLLIKNKIHTVDLGKLTLRCPREGNADFFVNVDMSFFGVDTSPYDNDDKPRNAQIIRVESSDHRNHSPMRGQFHVDSFDDLKSVKLYVYTGVIADGGSCQPLTLRYQLTSLNAPLRGSPIYTETISPGQCDRPSSGFDRDIIYEFTIDGSVLLKSARESGLDRGDIQMRGELCTFFDDGDDTDSVGHLDFVKRFELSVLNDNEYGRGFFSVHTDAGPYEWSGFVD